MRWAGGAGGNSPGKTLGFCAERGDMAWAFPRIPLGMCGALEFGEEGETRWKRRKKDGREEERKEEEN